MMLDEFTSDDAWAVLDRLVGTLKWTKRAVSSATGLPLSTASAFLGEVRERPRRTIGPGNARAICTHGEPLEGRVGAVGAMRRGRALMRIGYGRGDLAAELGLPPGTVNGVVRGDHERVDALVAADFVALYVRLLARGVGTSLPAAEEAKANGWAGPGDWRGLDIDDPAVRPPGYARADKPAPSLRVQRRRRWDAARKQAARAGEGEG